MKDIVIGSPTAGTTDLGYRGCLTYLSGNIGSNYEFWGNFCPQYDTNESANDGMTLTTLGEDTLLISGIYFSESDSRQSTK